jgi:hypothetical protein
VPEDLNIEVARSIHDRAKEEAEEEQRSEHRHERALEIVEAVLLATVAIATAWSGYQAARWDGVNGRDYALAAKYRAQANQAWTLGGQQRLFDSNTFYAWLAARTSGNDRLAALYTRRFSPEYHVAFVAWLAAGGLTKSSVPPGPSFMPEYHNRDWERAAALERSATATFDLGTEARNHGDDYVRDTVLFATVLFLTAVGQRFRVKGPRVALLGVSMVLLVVALYFVATYPAAP